jgi:protocatechuate 3,4-dioxygenase beta subunit
MALSASFLLLALLIACTRVIYAEPATEKKAASTASLSGSEKPPVTKELRIAGVCCDDQKRAVAGARAVLYLIDYKPRPRSQERLQVVETDREGRFRFAPVASIRSDEEHKDYAVIVTAPHRATASIADISRRRPEHLEFTMSEAGSLRGKITGPNGQPVEDAQVWVPSPLLPPVEGIRAARTNASGEFEIADMEKKDYSKLMPEPGKMGSFSISAGTLYIRHPRFAWTAVSYTKVPSTLIVTLKAPAVIEGRVLNGETGEPAAGVWVEARGVTEPAWPSAVTDSKGRYRLESLGANQYVIWAEKEGWTVHGIEGFNLGVGEVKTAPEMRLIRGQFIVGQVINADTSRPIRPMLDDRLSSEFVRPQIALTSGPSRPAHRAAYQLTAVEADGSFRIRVAPGLNWITLYMPETWKVLASPPGTVQTDTQQVSVVDGKQVKAEFRVQYK